MREPIHPGETLREDLDALGRSEAPANHITEILNGPMAHVSACAAPFMIRAACWHSDDSILDVP